MLMLIGFPAHSFDEWDKSEIVMEAGYIALHLVDWGQTLNIAEDENYYECNPFLKDHPNRREVNRHFAATLIAQPIISHILPHEWRKAWIASGLAIEVSCVANNHSIGIRMAF